MEWKGMLGDVEIKTVVKNPNVRDLFRAYNIRMEGDEDEDEVIPVKEEPPDPLDVTVPIVEMTYDDDESFKYEPNSPNGISLDVENHSDYRHQEDVSTIHSDSNSGQSLFSGSGVSSEDIYRCDICSAGFRIKHSITKHKRVVHGMHQFACMFCPKSYPLKRNLLDHILTHKGPHGFKCRICNKVRPNYVSIQRHVKTHAQKNIPCLKCDARFKTKWELKSHEIQHSKERVFKCDVCQINFINPTKLREHLSQSHQAERPFRCDICGKDFNAQGNLTNHKKLHADAKPYKCQYCSLSFLTNGARKKHLPIHDQEKCKPYECEDCHKKYTSSTSLAVHKMKFHSGESTYHCHYCKEKFTSKSEISAHVAEHAAERPHKCQHCVCRYKNRRELKRHQREKDHFDTEERKNPAPPPFITLRGDGKSVDDESGDEGEVDWEMPEPEVCLNVDESGDDDE